MQFFYNQGSIIWLQLSARLMNENLESNDDTVPSFFLSVNQTEC